MFAYPTSLPILYVCKRKYALGSPQKNYPSVEVKTINVPCVITCCTSEQVVMPCCLGVPIEAQTRRC